MKERRVRETKPQKKPYVKPEVRQVQLKPEEAVLGFCKATGSSVGPFHATCTTTPLCSITGS
jgi:hypothetical protein